MRSLLLLLLLSAASSARAETWRVDLIVFRYLGAAGESGASPQAPGFGDAIELTDTGRLSAAGITVLPDSDFRLPDHWARLKSSAQFRPLIRVAWTQNDPPAERGPSLRLRGGPRFALRTGGSLGEAEIQEVDGTVALRLGRFLHLDTDLVFTQAGDDPASWLLDEKRKMRSDELHHLDSGRLGVLAKVVRWGP